MKITIYDGINIVFGLQGQGKTFVCTYLAVHHLLNGKKKVLTNYPVIFYRPLTIRQKLINFLLDRHVKLDEFKLFGITIKRQIPEKLQTYVWRDEFTGMAIKDSLIIVDESHDKYTGAYAFELTKDDRKFFSRLRHNGNAVYLMSQSFEDIHPFIKRRTAFIHEMKKRKWVFLSKPSCFFMETYSSVKDYINKDLHKHFKNQDKTIFNKQKIPFDELVSNAYNTHYFRDMKIEPKLDLWDDELDGKTIASKFNNETSTEDNGNGKKKKGKKPMIEVEA